MQPSCKKCCNFVGCKLTNTTMLLEKIEALRGKLNELKADNEEAL